MARRKLLPKRKSKASGYFAKPKGVSFFSTGCQLFDCALGGGWAQGRIINIVGDKSTGKTLLAIEACANFAIANPRGIIRYKEAEAAFDRGYAELLGAPLNRMEFEEDFDTVEDVHKDITDFAERCVKKKAAGLYIVDSLDALSDKAEQGRDMEKGSYGAEKAKLMSQMFRREKRHWSKAKVTVIFISQVRDKINAMFGRKWTRSGGRALDFYASQVVYLAELKKLQKTVRGVKRPNGVEIRVKVTKNKVGIPFRECDFTLLFGYGIDDVTSTLNWLKKVKALSKVGVAQGAKLGIEAKKIKELPAKERKARMEEINEAVRAEWQAVEEGFLPTETKY